MDWAASSPLVDEDHVQQLKEQGWFIIDDFLPEELAVSLRAEAKQAYEDGKFSQHRFQFGSGTFEKPSIFEADLHDETLQEPLASFAELLFEESLGQRLNHWWPELALEEGFRAKTLKVQRNGGQGGCFPCHYDNSGPPSKRSITCLVYLNPDWTDGDGGELVLHPFLEPDIIIAPLMRRAVFFRSDLILHSVRPSSAERFCFTLWLDGPTNSREDVNLTAKLLRSELETVDFLKRSPVQRSVSRAVNSELYEESLLACMSGMPGCDEMLQGHRQHVTQQLAHPQLGPFVEFLRSFTCSETVRLCEPLTADVFRRKQDWARRRVDFAWTLGSNNNHPVRSCRVVWKFWIDDD
ncbi:unnamed protein product [Durusdinium trenchii]|uniref:Fe2OG dioxygenase domain-containing protein n=1 Tax=Durusdinium trenchii TaxID=1381693 RepID=A0ABP0JLD8_9DINO